MGLNPITLKTAQKFLSPTFALLKKGTAIKGFPGTGTTNIPLVLFSGEYFFGRQMGIIDL